METDCLGQKDGCMTPASMYHLLSVGPTENLPDLQTANWSVSSILHPPYCLWPQLTFRITYRGRRFSGAKKSAARKYIFASRDRMDQASETIRAVRDHRYKYIRNYRPELPYFGHIPYRDRAAIAREILRLDRSGSLGPDQWQLSGKTKPNEEFYDCQTDPEEIKNLVDDPSMQEKLAELRIAHEQWKKRVGDLGYISETELVKKIWPPDGVQPTTLDPVIEIDDIENMGATMVTITCPSAGASIAVRQNDDGRWLLYTEPFRALRGTRITARAHRIGYKASNDVSWTIKNRR